MVGSRGRALVGSLVASALALGTAAPAASAQDGPICRSNARCDFSQDGVVDVPEGVRSLTIVAVGAPGAGSRLSLVNRPPNARCLQNPSCARLLAPGGRGARVEATTPVVPNQRLYVHLGRPGLASEQGAPGGGATWVSATPEEPRPGADARVVTAGGGGGSSTADFGDKIAGSPGGDAGEPGSPQPFLLGAFGVADDARAGLGGGPGTTHAGGKAGRSTATLGGQPPQAGGFVAGAPSRAYSGGGGDGIYGGGAGGVGFDGRFSAPGGSAGGGGGASGVANGVTLVSLGRATTAPSASIVFTGRPATSNLDKDSFELSIGGEVVARATQQTTYRPAAATRTDEISLLLVGVTPVGPRLAEYAKLAPTDRAATVLRGGVMRITNPTRPTVLLCLSGLHRPSVGNHSAVTGGYDVVSFGFERSEPCSKAVTPVPGLTAEMLPNGGRPRDVLRIACLRPGGCNGVVRATQGELHQPVVFRLAANRQVTKTLDGFTETPVLTVSESGYEPEDGRKITQGPISAKSQVKTARTTAMVQARTGGDGWVKALALATTPMSSGPSTPLPQILAPGASEPPPPFDPGPLPLPTISLGCPATAIAGDAVRITGSTSTPLPVQITVTAPDGTQTSRQVRDVSQAGDPSFATTVEVIQTGTWTVQATAPVQQPATCSIAVTQTPTALTAACGPDPVPPGGAAAVSGVLTPAGEPRSIVLRYVPTGAGQTTVVRTVTTDALGRWSDSGFLPVAQQYDVTASFAGTTPLAASSSAPCRIALPAVTLACPASAIAGARVSVTGTTNVTATPVHLIITAPDGTPTEHDVSARGGTYADDFPVAVAGTWRVGAAAGGAEAPPCLITVTAPPPPPSTTPTSLTITCPQGMVQTGQAVTTSGRLTPAAAGQTITVRYVPTVGQSATVVRATTTDAGGNYADSGFVTQAAQYDVTASFAGNGTLAPSASPTCRFTRS